jgi:hypothetical protein
VAVHYTIQEFTDALRVDVRREIALWERLLGALLGAFFVWQFTERFLPVVGRAVLAIALAAAGFALFRSLSARLWVTKLELKVDGALRQGPEGDTKVRLTVLTAKIYRLEYQEHEADGQGIYAVTAFGEPQVLPYVDGAQADEIIAAIKTKFPGLAEMWKRSEAAAEKSAREKSARERSGRLF